MLRAVLPVLQKCFLRPFKYLAALVTPLFFAWVSFFVVLFVTATCMQHRSASSLRAILILYWGAWRHCGTPLDLDYSRKGLTYDVNEHCPRREWVHYRVVNVVWYFGPYKWCCRPPLLKLVAVLDAVRRKRNIPRIRDSARGVILSFWIISDLSCTPAVVGDGARCLGLVKKHVE